MYFGEFEKDCLEAHNQYRARHHSPPLVLDIGLCKYAHEWAQHLASRNTLQHRSNNNYGENIFMSMGRTNISGRDAVRSWYEEVQDYNFHGGGFSQGTRTLHKSFGETANVWVLAWQRGAIVLRGCKL
ncbi:Golgi-associated plant pathogenesis-related protein 1-like [Rhagoletis pomonella]|uniref:Golgi-associated plant pathogenesis-related protein 1-like n=1 Tax=Rhagoletis pomonella TaxID=28610 RepID=UPI001785949C|nr:Golgi-associated plant pathogenesis-related protein 1-like [Rhagoletis pomonella]